MKTQKKIKLWFRNDATFGMQQAIFEALKLKSQHLTIRPGWELNLGPSDW
jgi:hypothetical protein